MGASWSTDEKKALAESCDGIVLTCLVEYLPIRFQM